MIRVLVAEDSVTARALIVQILSDDPEIEVVGEAKDGIEAIALTQTLRPDLVTMDINMPRLDGLAATKEIMITAPTPIIIVSGTLKASEVEASMISLWNGALDVLVKPPSPFSPDFAAAARNLVVTVKTMSQVKVIRHWRQAPPRAVEPPVKAYPRAQTGRVVAVATSTGGPPALQRLLSDLPRDLPVPILIVQHIPPGFTAGLAAWLNSVCATRVKVAEPGLPLEPGTVYLAPDDRHLGASSHRTVVLLDTPPVGGFRPSATVLFESVAKAFGSSAVGVILTGMGEDGVEGLRAIRAAGGRVIAQDEKSSVIFGMPGAAVAAGLANAVLPLDAIASHLVSLI